MDPMTMAALTSLGSSALGALGSGGGTEKIQAMESIPRFLRDDYKALAGQVQGLATPEYFQGNQVAGLNPLIGLGLTNLAGYGDGMGGQIAGAQFGAGMTGAGAMGGGMDFLSQYASAGPNLFEFDQGTFNSIYNNPNIDAMIDATNRDVARGLNWDTMPGLQMSGTAAGLQGSTKLGQAGALATAMAGDRMADNAAMIRNNAFNQATSGAMQAGGANLGSANQFGGDIMSGYNNLASLGLPQLAQAYGTGMNNFDNQFRAGQYFRDFDQQNIDADMAKWNYEQNAPMAHLQNQLSMIPGPGGMAPGTPGMTPWEGALQGLQAAPSLYNIFNSMGTGGSGSMGGTAAGTPLVGPSNLGWAPRMFPYRG